MVLVASAWSAADLPLLLEGVPNMGQENPAAALPGGGAAYCAPVAVANSLAWLQKITEPQAQYALARQLGSASFMHTSEDHGTDTAHLISGVKKYLREHGLRYERLEYAGWRNLPEAYRSAPSVDIEWLRQAIHPHHAVWLNIGWYREEEGRLHRVSGHWVTLTGHSSGVVTLHDPGPWAQKPARAQAVPYTVQENLPLTARFFGPPVNRRMHIVLDQAMPRPIKNTVALIEGAVRLEMRAD